MAMDLRLVLPAGMGWEWPLPTAPSQEPLDICLIIILIIPILQTKRGSPRELTLLPKFIQLVGSRAEI